MPNSIMQGLVTDTPAGLNRLGVFPTTVLLGLLTRVDPKRPEAEVCVRPSDILEIIQVGKSVAYAVERRWETTSGPRRKQYEGKRYSPKQMQRVLKALLALHDQKVAVRRFLRGGRAALEDRVVHVLDMFGYRYEDEGQLLDVDDLPRGRERVNVGSAERPVWRVSSRAGGRTRALRPSGVLFRLNAELAREVTGEEGTIKFTHMARRVFGVLRLFCREPAAVRLLLLVVRQTGPEFQRHLGKTLGELGWDPHHRARSVEGLRQALKRMMQERIVTDYHLEEETDLLRIRWNKGWYEETPSNPASG